MKQTWTALAALAAAAIVQGHAVVSACTHDRAALRPFVQSQAEDVAGRLFASIGIEVRWVPAPRCAKDPPTGSVVYVYYEASAPSDAPADVSAFARFGGSRVPAVYLLYDRVLSRESGFWYRPLVPTVMGYLLAHELTHAIQGVVRHSTSGLMKPYWTARDQAAMVDGKMTFTSADVVLLRARLGEGKRRD